MKTTSSNLKDLLSEIQKVSDNAQEDVHRLRNRSGTQLSINGGSIFFIFYFFGNEMPIEFTFIIIPMLISSVCCIFILLPRRITRATFSITGNLQNFNAYNFYDKTLIPYYNTINSDNRQISDSLAPYLIQIYYWFLASFFMGTYLLLVKNFILEPKL